MKSSLQNSAESSGNSSPSPALQRGLMIIRILGDGAWHSLEDIVRATGYPKASVSRILQTLCEEQTVLREGKRGKYRAQMRLVPVNSSDEQFNQKLNTALHELADRAERTIEWYVEGETGMIMIQQASPREQELRIQAKIGYTRPFVGELEAVTVLANALLFKKTDQRKQFWTYDRNGAQIVLTEKDVARRVEHARQEGMVADENYNPNGVRRAAAVVIRNGCVEGILALAEGFTPTAEQERPRTLEYLKNMAKQLSEC